MTRERRAASLPRAVVDAAGGNDASRGGGAQGQKRVKRTPAPPLFDLFWAAYPRKVAKDKALRAWRRLNPDPELFQAMSAALERAKASREWQKEGGAYIPYPATWLNGRRWEDEEGSLQDCPSGEPSGQPLRGEGVRYS